MGNHEFLMSIFNRLRELMTLLAELFSQWSQELAPQGGWPSAVAAGLTAFVVGVLLSLWGERLLRFMYVLVFMAAGAAAGVHLARWADVDILIGLVLGAGLAGLAGHILYRWWLGITAGLCAVLLVAVTASTQNLPALQSTFESFHAEYFQAAQQEYATEPANLPEAGFDAGWSYLQAFADYCWAHHRNTVLQIGLILMLSWLTGLGMGLTLPRFTMILGTSVVGVLSLMIGTGLLLSTKWPAIWTHMQNQLPWVMAITGGLLVVSVIAQTRGRHRKAAPAPAAQPATT
jgi:hypothetical protein